MTQSSGARIALSTAIIAGALALTYAPLPGLQQTVTVVSGSELQEPLAALEPRFEQANPNVDLVIKIQGSQDVVNNYLDDRNDFKATVLIPANGDLLEELRQRWQTQTGESPFYEEPQPVAKTLLVAIAWPERGKALFPNGQFQWSRLEQAIEQANWGAIGGNPAWGSFDFVTTDPTRSNSGQLTLTLWSEAALNTSALSPAALNAPPVQSLFAQVKSSVYQPPRSTDILLQEFITRGPNDADIATVYESIALHRWEQSGTTQNQSYEIYYLDRTVETVSTAAILRQDVSSGEAKAARTFLEFLAAPEQQTVFVQHGFRPVNPSVDLESVPNSPWSQGIPGAEVNPPSQISLPPDRQVVTEVIRLWQRAN
ncbi:substrate-binding domain-containing protein [Pseudanabaena sp. FACHB-2040]|uniref:substrate-binding domain-containing protein n=1 Tax=Pseudanabaena sp. FACHB-2040 TaxID=2692859 RepID=UPI001682B19D|nr:substrate-binding domain-containing protein [Pseudanabaena sp. FACHB-2040]MBD2256746.1 substrate-binding domain-containing protein [Pseudanabaena sp. FACHB-2040]